MPRRPTEFQTIRSEGGLLPPDLLRRVLDPQEKLDGTSPEDYGLPLGERLNEIIQSWNRLRKHWAEFRAAAANLPKGEGGTGLTNEKLSLPLLRELGFGLLPTSAGPEVGGRTYAISRFFGPVPVHLIGCGLSLDRRAAGVRGAAAVNPHGLVQEFLNRSTKHLWGIIANGLGLRILRDSQALSRQSFLEFDLAAIFDGEVYSDFILLWLVAHATRFAPKEADRPDTCWLEKWTKVANEQGTRALGDLRGGVEKALLILGEGLTGHPKNTALRDALRTGRVPLGDFHGQLLRIVYRLIFLFVSEDRTIDGQSLLHPHDAAAGARLARERYINHYSTSRLRELAAEIKGSRHGDLWRQFQLLVGALSGDMGYASVREHLALPTLGSFLWDPTSTAVLNDAELTNHDFLEALRHLAFTRQGKILRPVDYKNLGAEELGGVYESLLALTPQISADGARFNFAEFAGSERKTSGSYYTPDALVQSLLDSALDPVVEEAIRGKAGAEAEQAILGLKVCDPAVGSGHFLVGAAHRLARHLARARAVAQGESEPSPLLYQHALREVIGHCVYGVDVNPMAAELCRVSMWLEALEPDKPLSFLDHHIRVGNSLLGATPELIAGGLPDDAFTAIEGDDRRVCTALRKRNKQEREGQRDMLHILAAEPVPEYDSIAARTRGIDEAPDGTIDEIHVKAEQYRQLVVSSEYRHAQDIADTWCAAFVWRKRANVAAEPPTTDTIRRLEVDAKALTRAQRIEIEQLSAQYQFFHWRLAFPEVFAKGGFDCVLGNPPWETLEFKEGEWFARSHPEIATAPTSAQRKQLIADLEKADPVAHEAYLLAFRRSEGGRAFYRSSGRYPLCGVGKINTYAVFAETCWSLLSKTGRIGCVLPAGIATDDTTKHFFQALVKGRHLVRLDGFENEDFVFPTVHHSTKFCLLTATGVAHSVRAADFIFFARAVEDTLDQDRRFRLEPDDIALINPNTLTCPVFRYRKDAELAFAMYRRVPVLVREHGTPTRTWNVVILQGLFNMATDSHLFIKGNALGEANDLAPLYESKMIHQFDHRFGTYLEQTDAQANQGKLPELSPSDHADASHAIMPRYYVQISEMERVLGGRWDRRWLVGWRAICRSTDSRTVIATIVPRVAVGHTMLVLLPGELANEALLLVGCLNSFCFDYAARQKSVGASLSIFNIKQLPILPADRFRVQSSSSDLRALVQHSALELTYTAWDLEPFARDCGWAGAPFRWDEERRFLMRCELDAIFFHLYFPTAASGDWRPLAGKTAEDLAGLRASFPSPRDVVAYVMDTFPIVKRKDEEKYGGDYRTKRVILDIYDAIQESICSGKPYQTRLDPPAADERCCHPPRHAEAVAVASPRQSTGMAPAMGRREGIVSLTDQHVLVLCRVIDKHRGTRHERTLGAVKAEKIAHVVESHLGVDLGREPKRLAAGPADFPHFKRVVHRAERGLFAFRTEERPGGQGATFFTMNGFVKALRRYGEIFSEQTAQIDRIIELFLPMDTEQAEIVATLYAVWNDQLACGATPNDIAIVEAFFAWGPGKRRIARERLLSAISWMREKDLMPTGRGKRTEPD